MSLFDRNLQYLQQALGDNCKRLGTNEGQTLVAMAYDECHCKLECNVRNGETDCRTCLLHVTLHL